MGKRFSKNYQVTYYDCDSLSRMKLSSLLSVLLYYSGMQCAQLGRSDSYFHALGLTWVITDYTLDIERMPSDTELLTIKTEAKAFNKFFTYREFEVLDASGQSIIRMEITFALMKLEDRKLGSLTQELLEPFEAEKVKTIKRAEKIPIPENPTSKSYEVRYSDLDTNQHVNNTKYIDWCMDSLGASFLTSHNLKHIHLRFVKEVSYGSTVECLSQVQEDKSIHQLLIEGNLHFECMMTWEERDEK